MRKRKEKDENPREVRKEEETAKAEEEEKERREEEEEKKKRSDFWILKIVLVISIEKKKKNQFSKIKIKKWKENPANQEIHQWRDSITSRFTSRFG